MKYIFCALLFVTASVADTININWINDDETYAQTTCEIGGDIILPEPPTKRGYTFKGWVMGYTRLEYIESTGTQYIDTGIKANSAYTYNLDVSRKAPVNSNIWGVKENASYSADSCLIISWTGNTYIGAYSHKGSGSGYNPNVVNWGNEYQKHSIIFNPTSSKLIIDGNDVWNQMKNGCLTNTNWSSTSYNLYIGGTNTVGSFVDGGPTRWYKYKVENGENSLQELIPAKRNSDNVIGMYDLVSNTFFTNQGTGEFIAGPVAENQNFYE